MTALGLFYIPVFILHMNYYKNDRKIQKLKIKQNSLSFILNENSLVHDKNY